jgi:hypothetical protein
MVMRNRSSKKAPVGESAAKRLTDIPPGDSKKEIDLPVDVLLDMEKRSYEEDANPITCIRAILFCDGAGLSLPLWVVSWLVKAFREYCESYGRKDLASLMGLAGAKGKDPAFKKFLMRRRDDILLTDIALLKGVFAVSLNDAAYMVERRLEETPESEFNKSEWPIERPKARRLKDLYSRNPIYKKIEEDIKKEFGERWTEEQKRNCLRRYPKKSLPEELRTYFLPRFK